MLTNPETWLALGTLTALEIVPKGYIYFAMGFSVMVEMINLRMRGAMPLRLQRTCSE